MEEIQKEDIPKKKGFWKNEFVIFLLGPLVFLVLVKFTGYQVFYNQNEKGDARLKFVLLLSGGTLFYTAVIVTLFAISE